MSNAIRTSTDKILEEFSMDIKNWFYYESILLENSILEWFTSLKDDERPTIFC